MAFLNDALSPEVGQFFRDQLEALIAAEFDREYPVHYKECVPVTDIEDGLDGYSDTITYRQYDSYGTLSVVSDQMINGNRLGGFYREVTHKVQTQSGFDIYTSDQINRAAALSGRLGSSKITLEDGPVKTVRRASEDYLDRGYLYGDDNYGLQGLLTLPFPEYVYDSPWENLVTGEDLLAAMQVPIRILTGNALNSKPQVMVLPPKQWELIHDTLLGVNNETVESVFMRNQGRKGYVSSIVREPALEGAGINGEDVGFILPWDKKVLSLAVARPLEYVGPTQNGSNFALEGKMRTALIVCNEVLYAMRLTGL